MAGGNNLATGRDKSGLFQSQGPGRDGGGERVCNIVCADIECIEKGKDNAERKNVRILRQGGHTEQNVASLGPPQDQPQNYNTR